MADRKVIQFTGTDGNDYDVRDEAAQQMIGTTALPTTAQTITGAIAEHETDLGTKADKVASAVNGNFAGLDGNGNLTDSGSKASDFVPVEIEINGKALSADVTLTGDDITVSDEEEQTVSDAIDELNTAVESKADQTQVDDIEKELTGKADKDSVFAYKEAIPGEVVEVYDAVAEAVKTMQIEIAPVQDLHGYDRPWVGGAGKNLLPMTITGIKAANTSGTWSGNEYTLNGVTFTLLTDRDDNIIGIKTNGTASAGTGLVLGKIEGSESKSYTLNGLTSQGSESTFRFYWTLDGATRGPTGVVGDTREATNITNVRAYVANGYTATNLMFYPMIRLATETDATFEPYSNICPISGFTGCETVREGTDLIPTGTNTSNGYEANKYLNSNGTSYASTAANVSEYFPVKAGESYTWIVEGRAFGAFGLCWYDSSKTYISGVRGGDGVSINTSTAPDNAAYCRVTLAQGYTEKFFVESNYNKYSITFPDGQTVYGGTLTVNADGTGTLVVDKKYLVYDGSSDESWSYSNGRCYIGGSFSSEVDQTVKGISNMFKWNDNVKSTVGNLSLGEISFGNTATNYQINVYPDGMSSASDFTTYLATNNLQILLKLVSSQPISLTAPQIRTILGYNRIYANTGSILSMLYPAEKYQTAEQVDRERIHAVVDGYSAVVSVTDGADNVPMKVQIAIEPVQDKHGYENPWPAGGGKNIAPSIEQTIERNGLRAVLNSDGTITVTGQNQSTGATIIYCQSFSLESGNTYTLTGCPEGGGDYRLDIRDASSTSTVWSEIDTGSGATHTQTVDASVRIGIRIAGSYSITGSLTFKPMVCLSTATDPTVYAPYSNICPITGWTGAEITRTGKNLFDPNSTEKHWVVYNGTEVSDVEEAKSVTLPVSPGQVYTLSNKNTASGSNVLMLTFFNSSNEMIQRNVVSSTTNYITRTAPANSAYMLASFHRWAETDEQQLELGATVTSYEPFGQTYTIIFPDEAGTVYGGTLTVNKDGTGELVVDRAIEEVPTLSEVTTSSFGVTYGTFLAQKVPSTSTTEIVVEFENAKGTAYNDRGQTPYIGYCNTTATYKQMLLRAGAGTTLEQFNAMYAGSKYVYKLATPITHTLPAPVIRSLLGTNNVFANTGDILRLEHCADTKLYIDGKIAELQAIILENINNA